MATLDVEQVDLAWLASTLQESLGAAIAGPLDGRTAMRDAAAEELGCSLLEAENVVDTLIARGFARLERDEEGREAWRLES